MFQAIRRTGDRVRVKQRRESDVERIVMELRPGRPFDVFVPPGQDDPVVNEMRRGRLINGHIVAVLEQFSAPDGRVVDFGAHLGSVALAVAATGRQVLAVDAVKSFVALMERSASANDFTNFRATWAAVGDRDGSAHFTVDGPFGSIARDGVGTVVPLRTGARLISECGWDNVDVMKVDVEGSEPEAFGGLEAMLRVDAGPAIIYESNAPMLGVRGVSVEQVRAQLAELGYSIFSIEGGSYAPVPIDQPQVEGVVDLVALKPHHVATIASMIRASLTEDELAARALEWSGLGAPIERLHLVEVLNDLRTTFRDHPLAREALERLATDLDLTVRVAARTALDSRG